ncbi:hypothetical protein [Micromonospora sp. NPDC005413]|uniref:hypothetical protein n=1 Tax=Micromonospora sp. NPDC005413 TaxID=3154563 RepID=UPI0033BA459B
MGVRPDPAALEPGGTMFRLPLKPRVDLFFLARTWAGTPQIREPHKYAELVWPTPTTARRRPGLHRRRDHTCPDRVAIPGVRPAAGGRVAATRSRRPGPAWSSGVPGPALHRTRQARSSGSGQRRPGREQHLATPIRRTSTA